MGEIDLGFGSNLETNNPDDSQDSVKTDITTGKEDDDGKNKIDNQTTPADTDDNKDDTKEDKNDDNKNNDDKNNDEDALEAGTKIEVGDTTYTVDNDGNLVDDKGGIFKKADEVKDYLNSLQQADEDDDKEVNINNIIEAIGIDILDDNDKPVVFENTPEGINQYVNAVINTTQQEIAETAINTLFDKYPVVKEFFDYYVANGNSYEGFSEHPDRSNIEIEESNEAQQEGIIRTAWKEQNRKGDVDSYIAYLKSSGSLKTVAEQELQGLKDADAAYRQQVADEAKLAQEAEAQRQKQYWEGVKQVVDSKQIAGYKIPDTILIERNGKKVAATPNDFFNYIYRTDKEGYTQYQRDLAKDTAESRRDDEILRAYLKFVGGNYSNLVDMAINEKEVKKLRFKAKENITHKTTYKITPPTDKKDKTETDFGY